MKINIFNVKIENEERKALDLIDLKKYLEEQRMRYSVLNIDPSSIEGNEQIMQYIAKAAIDTLVQLETVVDKSLGLYDETETIEPEVEKVEQEIVNEEPKKTESTSVPKMVPEKKVDEESDEIII